jgi:hypothetical protein
MHDPLDRALKQAARRTEDPALRRWILNLLRAERGEMKKASSRSGGRSPLCDEHSRAAKGNAPARTDSC